LGSTDCHLPSLYSKSGGGAVGRRALAAARKTLLNAPSVKLLCQLQVRASLTRSPFISIDPFVGNLGRYVSALSVGETSRRAGAEDAGFLARAHGAFVHANLYVIVVQSLPLLPSPDLGFVIHDLLKRLCGVHCAPLCRLRL
jgi:hypothetical protein